MDVKTLGFPETAAVLETQYSNLIPGHYFRRPEKPI